MSVKIKYIPNILKYENRTIDVQPYCKGKSIRDYLETLGYDTENVKAIVDGKKVDLDYIVKENDEIIVTPEVKFSGIVAVLSWIGFEVGTFWVGMMALLDVMLFVYSMVSTFLLKPRTPSFGGYGEGLDVSSPTYGWDGIRTIQEVGVPVPIIYGRHRVGGNVANAYVRTDGDKNYLNVLLITSEGEINSISSLLINDNPSANFDGISTTTKMGTNSQTIIPNFEDAHNLYNVNVNLTKNNAHVYTTVDSDVEGFTIQLQLPSGLFQEEAKGGVKDWSVTYKVEYKVHTDPAYTDLGSTTITTKSRTTVRRSYRKIGLTAEQYDIRVTRTSDDSSLDPFKQGDLTWTQMDEVKTDDFIYPNTALYGIEALATNQLSGGMPNFSYLVEGRLISIPDIKTIGGTPVDWEDYYWDDTNSLWKLLSDNTVLAWDGTTYVDKWSANPIWCMKDLMTNTRYGLGDYIEAADIDNTLFLEMAKHCEEKVPDGEGGYEKRFRLDVVIDSSTKALDVINQLCRGFRGMPFYSEGKIKIRIDKDETPVQLFTMGNINKDSFAQSWKSRKDAPNVVEIQFLDKDKDYKQDTIAYIDEAALAAGDPMRKKTIRLFVTHISQVIREARYALKQTKYLKRAISFSASIDAIACQPGDLISVQHDVPQWGFGGRVIAGSTTTKIMLDQEVTLEAGTYKILICHSDDVIEEKTVSTGASTTDEIEVVGDAFGFTPSAFDKYSIGKTNKVKKDFRVMSMKIDNQDNITIMAMEHDTDVYDDSAITIPDNNYSSLSLTIPVVRNLALTERIVVLFDGTIENVIDVWWDSPAAPSTFVRTYYKANIYISEDNVNWKYVGESFGTHFGIAEDILQGVTYYIAVASVADGNVEDRITNAPSDNITITSTPSAPSAVGSFANTFEDEIDFTWDKNSEGNIKGYEIRVADSNWGVDNTDLKYRGMVNRWTEVRPTARSGITYYIKAYSTSDVYSDSAASLTPSNAAPAAPTITKIELFQKSFVEWDDVADKDLKHYEVWSSSTNAWAGEENLFTKVIGRVIAGTGIVCLVNVPDNPTYFKVRGVDSLGAGAFSASLSISTVQIVTADIATNAITANEINANAITTNELNVGAVTEAKIASGAITTTKITNGAITTGKITAGAVTATEIASNAVTADKIIANAVHASEIAATTITASELAGACVKQLKLDTSEQIVSLALSYDIWGAGGASTTTSDAKSTLSLNTGLYGLYPQQKVIWGTTNFPNDDAGIKLSMADAEPGTPSYLSAVNMYIWYTVNNYGGTFGPYSATMYAKFKYISSSSDTFWIFLKVVKKDIVVDGKVLYKKGQVVGISYSPDHPSVGNNVLITHPFGKVDESAFDIVLVDNSIIKDLLPLRTYNNDFATLINDKCVIDNNVNPHFLPRKIHEIDEWNDRPGKIIERAEIPEALRYKYNTDEWLLKERAIETLPSNIKYRKLKIIK